MVTNAQERSDAIFEALGDGTRREILRLLRDGPLPVGMIAERLPVSRPAVSKHLRTLRGAGLVDHESHGTRNVFALDESGFQAAREYLDGFWNIALGNFEQFIREEERHA